MSNCLLDIVIQIIYIWKWTCNLCLKTHFWNALDATIPVTEKHKKKNQGTAIQATLRLRTNLKYSIEMAAVLIELMDFKGKLLQLQKIIALYWRIHSAARRIIEFWITKQILNYHFYFFNRRKWSIKQYITWFFRLAQNRFEYSRY